MTAPKHVAGLCAFEYNVLAMLAGAGAPLPWGAAVGAALGFLKGGGYVSFNGIGYDITERGRNALATRAALA